ncbi:phosphoglucosamine mutase [Planifilum fulgidum]|jgi:phosphoglucosamine mutase|uniref:Phosphoglucosamine mutase n=1 Tax=Planifilum fulgidum TaxID=201973 RepID=A0A1I2T4U4_9BACL|nr:phosphoglucosamine mutase [Planifilum fulgidum]MBO2497099.1 phosphoglucosamine mutase [Bacillota bacterium]MBO2533661.1 phosphoglucosamine mutase [Thermoactinomycetaceae bacterium]SFG57231.1 phosphoglucosamine mutase [Planifilum fulgidum]
MGKYFGTDGVRGVANRELTPELAFRLGRCGAYVLAKQEKRPRVLIGRDTRLSGEMLEAGLVAGMLSIGCDVIRLGVITTPGVAYLTRALGASAGVMISASHNPFHDNGIKFFGPDGFKLSDETEAAIEELLEGPDRLPRPEGEGIGRVEDRPQEVERYLEYLKQTIDTDLCGLNLVVDCANGAASELAPRLLRDLGADVIAICSDPDGMNINVNCGSTHPERLQREVRARKADAGLAFDGDADRLIAVDERGQLVDGDHILCICGGYLKERGNLKGDAVVATVMSNIGMFKALESKGIAVKKTRVGDRYVMEEMRRSGHNLGGEQSGHIIFLDHSTTGDGLLTALQLLQVMKETGQTLGDLAGVMTKYPQLLVNVPVKDKNGLNGNEAIGEAVARAEELLGEEGRVLIRPSGTEPLIRVMAEGPDEETLKRLVEEIAETVRRELA